MDNLPLPTKSENYPLSLIKEAIKHSTTTGQSLVIVSSICPSYSTDSVGIPTYGDLERGISPNTQKHFDFLVPQIKKLESRGVKTTHFFLMADTEVDLLPFLNNLSITPEEFTNRCQQTVVEVAEKAVMEYGAEKYFSDRIPPAGRFLDFFGVEKWFSVYERFKERLLVESRSDPYGRIAKSLERDYADRKTLIDKLINNVSKHQGLEHIARQRAQYMTFAYLMREMFGKRLIVANHRTPNFKWMNDRITREPFDKDQLAKGNYLSSIPLVELDISTLPNN